MLVKLFLPKRLTSELSCKKVVLKFLKGLVFFRLILGYSIDIALPKMNRERRFMGDFFQP